MEYPLPQVHFRLRPLNQTQKFNNKTSVANDRMRARDLQIRLIYYLKSIRQTLEVKIVSTEKLEIELDADLMTKLKAKADAADKTPSEMVAEILRAELK